MGRGQELLDAAREGEKRTVEKILGQITKRSGPFTSLRRGAGVNVQDDNGYTPLHHACLNGHREIVRLLLSVEASPCVTDKKGATPLHLAAWKGDSDIVTMLLAHNNPAINIDQQTSDHETALLIAAQFGYVDVVAQLMARGADVTLKNIKEESALDLAAQYGRLETVQHLLRSRPQLVDCFKYPICRGQVFSTTPLHRASKNGHKEVVSTLIAAGIDPNVRTSSGTPLHEAACYGKASVVRILLGKGADLNALDRRGKTVHALLAIYSEEATRRVRKVIREYENLARTQYESEEDLPPFPVQDYSPTGYQNAVGMNAPKTHKFNNKVESFFSSSSSSVTKTNNQSFVKKLATKLGIKTKFSSAPNITNISPKNSGLESVSMLSKNSDNKLNSGTIHIGSSKFFKLLSKKEESGEINCNDEFDTISLDRLGTLSRDSVVNRSNRSCPGFKTSLPNISENLELSDESNTNSVVITEIEIEDNPINEAVNKNTKVNTLLSTTNKSQIINRDSVNSVNECYESYEFSKSDLHSTQLKVTIPKPPPRTIIPSDINLLYENVSLERKKIPKPATRVHIQPKHPLEGEEKNADSVNVSLDLDKKPLPPVRTVFPSIIPEPTKPLSVSISLSSSSDSDSMSDETNLEDILLSQKSKSFRHSRSISEYEIAKQSCHRTDSNASDLSTYTEASAFVNIDVSCDDKDLYTSMTGTLPQKKSQPQVKKKVLFRHKTFSNMEAERSSIKIKDFPKFNETLTSYHIRGTGHCIYSAPTVKEFIYIFNRDTLHKNVPPFSKVSNLKTESQFETAICFCKPNPPKHHKSAEDLLEITQNNEPFVDIDFNELKEMFKLSTTSFSCYCQSGDCVLHFRRRQSSKDLVVKFSAIKKSISTPDINLYDIPNKCKRSSLEKNESVPVKLAEPQLQNIEMNSINKDNKGEDSDVYVTMSRPSTLSSSSSAQPYSVKDISEALSLTSTDVSSVSSLDNPHLHVIKSSSSEYSDHWSLQSCNSNITIKSDASFKSCIEQSSDESDGDVATLHSDDDSDDSSDAETIKSDASMPKRPWVQSNSFRFGAKDRKAESNSIPEETDDMLKSSESKIESGISVGSCSSSGCEEGSDGFSPGVGGVSLGVALLERGGAVRSGSGRRRWEEVDGASEGDALSLSSTASSCAPMHLVHHQEYTKVSPTPPKKPPRRNLSVSPTHVNSPSSGYSYELRPHARSQDDLDDIQGAKHYLKHGRSVDQYVDGKLSHSEYEETLSSPRMPPVPNPRPSIKSRTQPVAITAMYQNVFIKEQNPRRKLRRNNFGPQDDAKMSENRPRKYSNQERSSLESLLDEQSANSPSDGERDIPLSPSHYEPPPTPTHPPPSARQAERSIHERIRPLSQEYKRRSALRDSYTETETYLLRAASAASVASGATDRSGTDCVEEYVCDVPFAGLFKGSTTTLDGIGLRPVPAERPKTLRKLKSVYDASPTENPTNNITNVNSNGQITERNTNGTDDDVRRRSNTTSSNQSAGDKSLSILSPFDEQEEWAKISEIMASFGSKLVRESVFVSELEQEFTSRLGLSCSESSLSPSVTSNLGHWLSSLGMHDYESLFQECGYDDVDFINGVLEESDLREIGVEEADRHKILESMKQLPLKIAEISNNYNNNNICKNQYESVDVWLRHLNLELYSDTFRRHLYIDMDRVRRIWEVELTAVLEIQKVGHRKRILASVSGEPNPPVNNIEDISADLNTLKSNIQQLKEEIKEKLPSENLKAVPPPVVPTLAPIGGETLKRSKKNRPAPQPPRPSDLEIREPSELLVGVPGALKTQWKHQPFVLVTGAVTYVANYLGSTVVKELRGTESTKKSIQKLKKTSKEPRDSPDIILSISYKGVKFLNTITRELVCEHEIRNIHCACQDADDLTHFAYITKDHTTKSHFCHVFRVATMDQATEVILTLGEAFEVAYQMALREQSIRVKVPLSHAKTPTHDPMTHTNKEKVNVNHGRSHSVTEIKLNGHQLKIAPIPTSLSNEDFQTKDGSRSPKTSLLKAPMASTEEL